MLQITLEESAVDKIIKLTNNDPEVIEILEEQLVKARKRFAKSKKRRDNYKQKRDLSRRNAALRFRADLLNKATEAEKVFKALLKTIDIKYKFQEIIYTKDSFYIVDFYLPHQNIVIEIDGGHHGTVDQKIKDKRRTQVLKDGGISKVFRFTNMEVLKDHEACLKRIQKLL